MNITPTYRFDGELINGEYRTNEDFIRFRRIVVRHEPFISLTFNEVKAVIAYLEQDFEPGEAHAIPIGKFNTAFVHYDDIDLFWSEMKTALYLAAKEDELHAKVS